MILIKLKPILPTLRENKRYVAFKVISKEAIDFKYVKEAILAGLKDYVGNLGLSNAGLIIMDKLYNPSTQEGVVRVSNKYDSHFRESLALIKVINNQQVIVRRTKSSGVINKLIKK